MANVLTHDHHDAWSGLKPRKSLTIGKEMLKGCQDEMMMHMALGYSQPLIEKILSGLSDYEMLFLGVHKFNGSIISLDMDGAGNAIIHAC